MNETNPPFGGGLGSFYEISFLKTRKASTPSKKEVEEANNRAHRKHIFSIPLLYCGSTSVC
jgi:hypothetical protein